MKAWEKRIDEVETVLIKWMREQGAAQTTPNDCMDDLIRCGIYKKPRGKARALPLRNDLRSLRNAYGMPYETGLLRIEQEAEHQKWYIYRK